MRKGLLELVLRRWLGSDNPEHPVVQDKGRIKITLRPPYTKDTVATAAERLMLIAIDAGYSSGEIHWNWSGSGDDLLLSWGTSPPTETATG